MRYLITFYVHAANAEEARKLATQYVASKRPGRFTLDADDQGTPNNGNFPVVGVAPSPQDHSTSQETT